MKNCMLYTFLLFKSESCNIPKKPHWIILFKWMNCMVYELHFNKTGFLKALWQLWPCATLLWDRCKRVKPPWEGGCFPLHWPRDVAEGLRAGLSPARWAAPVACVLTWGSIWMDAPKSMKHRACPEEWEAVHTSHWAACVVSRIDS